MQHNDKYEAPDKPMGELNLFHRLIVPFEQNDDRWRITYLEYMDLENNRHHNFSQVHYRGLCARTNTQVIKSPRFIFIFQFAHSKMGLV
jgi:hypothetical protein